MDFDVKEYVLSNPAPEVFKKLHNDRNTVMTRAVDSAKLTLPYMATEDSHTESDTLDTPFQAIGSRVVNSLASKLMLSLFPPNLSFFRLLPTSAVKQAVKQSDTPDILDEVEKQYMLIEQEMLRSVERQALRVPIFDALKSTIVTGNSCLYKTENGLKNYKIQNFVITRDFNGTPTQIIVKEGLNKNTLSEDMIEALNKTGDNVEDREETDVVTLYTRCVLRDGVWYEWQEVDSVFVDNSEATYKTRDELPFIPIRWTAVNGENYGRGHVEQYIGDFRSLEALYQIMIETSAISSKVVFGRRPGAITELLDLQGANNGDVIEGDLEQDISVLRTEKNGDMQIPLQLVQDLTRRLEQAFLVATSAVRNSERTTATEVRFLANDLEESLGGIYSIMSLELQKPLAYKLLKDSDVDVSTALSDIVIVTGVDALGRNVELDKIMQFAGIIQQIGSPELILPKLKIDNFIKMIGNSIALDVTTLVKTDVEVQAEQQAQQEQQLAMQGASNVVDNQTQNIEG